MTPTERLKAEIQDNSSLHWSTEAQMRVSMWALVSIAESLEKIADALPLEIRKVGDVKVVRTGKWAEEL